jgi:hypothetical protein
MYCICVFVFVPHPAVTLTNYGSRECNEFLTGEYVVHGLLRCDTMLPGYMVSHPRRLIFRF